MGKSYDPFDHAEQMGLTVVEEVTLLGGYGEYCHATRTVRLHPDLTRRERRCTLAHEIAHAVAGDVACNSEWFMSRMERRADAVAARLLVDPEEYAYAERLWNGHVPAMAHELDITPDVIRDFQRFCLGWSWAS